MVVGFRRTISFPAPKAATAAKGEAYRVRSASLPCRFHPLVVQLDEDVATMRELVGRLASAASAGSVAGAAEQLGRVLPSSLRIWWVADLMRWMSRAKRRSASKQHADSDASSSSTSSAATARPQPNVAVDPDERERKAAFERLDNLGRCIADVESIGEKVFRALVNTRVSLLNILSTSF
ncbi:hypothetical protein OsJ_07874 [Oryza sativa Japonica Group]|uniref:Uncharacterized protein n=1 Tax=Oryza sativa subsp. japonica TaxID=39947 RepID=B9F1K2_ORYSJ|nr:hypothetical protein OsJ_07874 [Oryza sativa Japonica Group]